MNTSGALERVSGRNKKLNRLGELKLEVSELTGLPKGKIFSQTVGMSEADLRYIMSTCKDAVLTGRKKNWGHAWNSEMVRVWKPKFTNDHQ